MKDLLYINVTLIITYIVTTSIFFTIDLIRGGTPSELKLIAECEKELPRSQSCELIAVPKEIGE